MQSEEILNPWANYQAFMRSQQQGPEREKRKQFVAEMKKLRKAKLLRDMMRESGMDPEMMKLSRIKERAM